MDSFEFLPVTRADMERRGIEQLDFICVTGDAYVDHPSFAMPLIARVLESEGFEVGMIAQPDVKKDADFTRFGAPRLGFFVNAGNIDSMVAHYTAAKKRRHDDLYTPGGKAGRRPDRAVTVYTKILRRLYPDAAIVIGGIEASLRRFAHYDYWDDRVRPSILAEAPADLLIYGMGERQTREIAKLLARGVPVKKLTSIRGTCALVEEAGGANCPSFLEVSRDKTAYARSVKEQYERMDFHCEEPLCQDQTGAPLCGEREARRVLRQNPPAPPLSTEELDAVYELPFQNAYHPIYEGMGGVPAIQEVEFSITHNRGCFGSCNFCALAFHQGRAVTSRSHESVLREAERLTKKKNFKGYIHDVGGPTANFRRSACKKTDEVGACPGRKCLAPTPCKNLEVSHRDYLELLRKLRALKGVKRVFIRSGIRYDYLTYDEDPSFFRELVQYHVSGQLKVAPEHISDKVLRYMGKPSVRVYNEFEKRYYKYCKEYKKEQYLVPYLMSSHPGSTLREAVELALYLKRHNMRPEQVQDFYPTPGTISTCMFYTGLDPMTMKPVYVPRSPEEKAMQRALLQYSRPENREIVRTALRRAGREDLIGFGPNCLVPPESGRGGRAPRDGTRGPALSGRSAPRRGGGAPAKGRKNSARSRRK